MRTITDDEIIKANKLCSQLKIECTDCPYYSLNNESCDCVDKLATDTIKLINRQKANVDKYRELNLILRKHIDRLEYILMGVMHSVDKWLEGDELNHDETNRAVIMREKTLQIVEKQQAEIDRLRAKVNRFKKYDEERDIRLHARLTETAKAEAIKEFAERFIQEDGYNNHNFDDCASILLSEEYRRGRDEKTKEVWKLIKRIKKEMVGDTNE